MSYSTARTAKPSAPARDSVRPTLDDTGTGVMA
jgi:hypothetical protein